MTGYNIYAYCGNNPVNRVDVIGHCWTIVGLVVLAGSLLIMLNSDDDNRDLYQAEANKKYNSSTVNINGNNPNGIVDVKIGNEGDSIQIKESYNISNPYEQEAILNTIIASEQYTSNYTNIYAMKIEWSGHNLGYHVTRNENMNFVLSYFLKREDANDNFANVDIKGVDKYQEIYTLVTLGGLIPW